MHARGLNMLHDARNNRLFAVANSIHIHLNGVFQKPVNE